MPLSSGTRLGPYEILSAIGAGGMGEVYRARDTKLNRDVALKILPAGFAADPDRLARFKREALVLASLNHPNIAAIYGLEGQEGQEGRDGQLALVLELVEGPTLADRIAQGPIPVDEASAIAKQIAEALEAAHEQGIIHRDLKPANIKVRPDGAVKILDFGLAKALEPAVRVAAGITNSPTITTPAMMTGVGMILGTAAYMSPEQAKGRPADKRSDVWAFGCVLYEMLTGKRAFEGDDVSDTLAAVLRGDPDWSALTPDTAPALHRLLRRSLQKDPRRRLPDIGVARLEIDEALTAPQAPLPAAMVPASPRSQWLAWAIAGLALAGALGLAVAMSLRRPQVGEDRIVRFTITLPEGWRLARAPAPFRLSPDGRRLLIVAQDANGRTAIWTRSLDSLTSQQLPGSDGATAAGFWSADSRFVAFRSGGRLKKIDVTGGEPVTLCEIADIRGGTWNSDGVILFASGQGLKRVSASGGVPVALPSMPDDGLTASFPDFLPDGRHFLYRTFAGIFVGSLDSPERTQLFKEGDGVTNAEYADGHLLYMRDTTLMAQPFDPVRLQLSAEPVPLADAVQRFTAPSAGLFSASANGVLAYETGQTAEGSQLILFDRSGKPLGKVGGPGEYDDVSLSPDGKRAAVSLRDPSQRTSNIWAIDLTSGLRTQLTFDPADDLAPTWSRDGTRIAFSSSRQGRWGLYQKASNGAGPDEAVDVFPAGTLQSNPLGWTKDSRSLLYVSGLAGAAELSLLSLTGDRKPVTLLSGGQAGPGQLSPDDRWVAYFSAESGRRDVYVRPFPSGGGKWIVSTDGGSEPRWRSDGKEIFYVNRQAQIVAAEVTTVADAFQVGEVRPLFTVQRTGVRYSYDVSPDGRRFLVNTRIDSQTAQSVLTVIVNWPGTLK
jgi:Tol biopolymer transport system component